MLKRCLRSLGTQVVPDGAHLGIVVVDNNADGSAQGIVQDESLTSPFPIAYAHEPRRGIAVARNAILKEVGRQGATWLLMVDDDQWLEPDSLVRAWDSAALYGADVVSLAFVAEFPKPTPFWCIPSYFHLKHEEGRRLKQCGTGGVLFKMSPGMAFDETLGLNGGEDTSFFHALHRSGALIVASGRARVHEEIVPERMSFYWQCYRDYCNAAANLKMHRSTKGARAIPARVWKAATRFVGGTLELPILPIYAVVNRDHFKFRALKVGKKIAWSAGIAAGLAGKVPEPYRNVTGY